MKYQERLLGIIKQEMRGRRKGRTESIRVTRKDGRKLESVLSGERIGHRWNRIKSREGG